MSVNTRMRTLLIPSLLFVALAAPSTSAFAGDDSLADIPAKSAEATPNPNGEHDHHTGAKGGHGKGHHVHHGHKHKNNHHKAHETKKTH